MVVEEVSNLELIGPALGAEGHCPVSSVDCPEVVFGKHLIDGTANARGRIQHRRGNGGDVDDRPGLVDHDEPVAHFLERSQPSDRCEFKQVESEECKA